MLINFSSMPRLPCAVARTAQPLGEKLRIASFFGKVGQGAALIPLCLFKKSISIYKLNISTYKQRFIHWPLTVATLQKIRGAVQNGRKGQTRMNFQQLRIIRETIRQDFNLTEVANALYT
ncbi:hypothetical protein, partial [Dechloromonas hortensis]|uniref:hypothetical protein n=1 Tax=Dechloromonas hortensis TaxID=337779 RepID=UPI0012923882